MLSMMLTQSKVSKSRSAIEWSILLAERTKGKRAGNGFVRGKMVIY